MSVNSDSVGFVKMHLAEYGMSVNSDFVGFVKLCISQQTYEI